MARRRPQKNDGLSHIAYQRLRRFFGGFCPRRIALRQHAGLGVCVFWPPDDPRKHALVFQRIIQTDGLKVPS